MSDACDNHNGHTNLSIINPNRRILTGPQLLHHLISYANPDHVAIDFISGEQASRHISYCQLRAYVQCLADNLLERCRPPFGEHDIIPVIIPQSPELYISYLAVLAAGAGFCPISPDTPPERLKFIIQDTNAKLVLTLPSQASDVKRLLPGIHCVSVSLSKLTHGHATNTPSDDECPTSCTRSTGIAYIMYTSGSTGRPKGVKVSHSAVTQSLLAHDEHIPKFKRFLQFASPTFDVSVFEIFFPLFRGATLVCCEREKMLEDLPGIIRTGEVDAAELTPTVASTLLRSRRQAPSLKILLTIGEMLTRQVIEEFGGSETQESILYAMYGPTEAAIHCTIAPAISATSSVKSIGRPLSTVTAFILAESADIAGPQILPIDQVGELAIAGQLADGYLNRPEQNAEAFITIPEYGAVYRTGDRAKMLDSGELHIMGRISNGQVKLRGQRVELGEVEEVADKLANVDLAVASVIGDALVLFCAGNDKLSSDEIEVVCSSWLPSFMRPTEIVLVPDIPHLPSGKIDRKGLVHEYKQDRERQSSGGQQFASDTETAIAEAISHELSTIIGPHSTLATSGLDSLRAIKIAATLRLRYPVVTAVMLLESRTIGDLVRRMHEEQSINSASEASALYEQSDDWKRIKGAVLRDIEAEGLKSHADDILPCAPIQTAMLVESLADQQANFNSIEVNLDENVTQHDFKQAMCQVAAKNAILRSGFVSGPPDTLPFVQVTWHDLSFDQALTLRHPLQMDDSRNKRRVIVRIHHALYDGWSWDLIMNDVNTILGNGQSNARPSFQEFRRALERTSQAKVDADNEYWRDLMAGSAPSLFPDLRSDRNSSRRRQILRKSLRTRSSTLRRATRDLGISQEVVVQAALALLLGSYCDASDITIGTVSSRRETVLNGMDQIIGPCLAVHPVRLELSSVKTVQDLLLYIHRLQLARLQHSSTTLSQIQKHLRAPPSSRLFDTLNVWQEGLTSSSAMRLAQTVEDTDELRYAIVLETTPTDEQIATKMTFDTSKIPSRQAEFLLAQLDDLIALFVTEHHLHLSSVWNHLDLSNLSLFNPEFKRFDRSFDLSSTIQVVATNDPARIAVQFISRFNGLNDSVNMECLSYEELFVKGSLAARNMVRHHHIKPNDLVCVLLDKSIDLYITILAVVLAGAGYMCINPQSPDSRISQILAEAKCKLIISTMSKRLRKVSADCPPLTTPQELLERCEMNDTKIPVSAQDGDLAYSIFTSGSTGIPKGVLLTRMNLLSNLDQLSKIYPKPDVGDKLLQACSQAFDVSVFEIFWTWHSGMTLCASSDDVLFRDIETFITKFQITHLSMTASVAALVDPAKIPSVKFLVTAGEPMNSRVFGSWSDNGLHQGYGPSETTNICNVRPFVSKNDHINNVGPAFANTSLFICKQQERHTQSGHDARLSASDFVPLPRGAIGEVWIGGDQVARGYMNPQLTARSFCEHPKYGYLYRSGDIGRLLEDNSLIVIGRTDDQIKLRGQRIELGEINSTFIKHELVKDFVSIVLGAAENAKLVGYHVSAETISEEQMIQRNSILFSWIVQQLPNYMVPDFLVPLKQLPLTTQGKADKRALTTLFNNLPSEEKTQFSRGSTNADDKSPLTEGEGNIAEVLARMARIPLDSISRDTSFFAVGLDSISSISFAQQLRKAGFSHVDVSTVLKNPSIGRLSSFLTSQTNGSTQKLYRIDREQGFDQSWKETLRAKYSKHGYQVDCIMPCTPLQEVMLSSSNGSDGGAYFNSITFDIKIEVDLIKDAWRQLVQRHALLRTVFIETEKPDHPYAQLVLKSFHLPWSDQALEESDAGENATVQLPPYQFSHSSRGGNVCKVSLQIHHALYDAEAMPILLKEVEQLVKDQQLASVVPFSRYLEYMSGLDTEHVDKFWTTMMKGCKNTRIADVVGHNSLDESSAVSCQAKIMLSRLEKSAENNKVTPLNLIQAALARLLSFLTSSEDVCFGNVFSGRSLAVDGAENIAGPCFNTLPVRARFAGRLSNKDLCAKMYQTNVDILPLQPSSLRRIQRQNSRDGKALFDMLLLFQRSQTELDQTIWSLDKETGDMDFPFILEIVPDVKSDCLKMKLHYQVGDRHTARQILQDFDMLLEQTAFYPQNLAADLDKMALWSPAASASRSSQPGNSVPNINGHSSTEDAWSPAEDAVRRVLEDFAQIPNPAIHPSTTIFRLGLDSINAVQIASKLREKGFKITSADIVRAPSIRGIAASCDESSVKAVDTAETSFDIDTFDLKHRPSILEHLSLDSEKVEAVLPCTSAQSGMTSQFLGSQGSLYYNSITLSLAVEVDIDRLRSAWTALAKRHEILRTGFVQIDSAKQPFAMIIYAAGVWPISWNGDACKTGDNNKLADRLARPYWQVTYANNNGKNELKLSMLHALYDAQSLSFMLNDVMALYKGQSLPQVVSWRKILPKLIQTDSHNKAKQFWTTTSKFLQNTQFPNLNVFHTDDQTLHVTRRMLPVSLMEMRQHCAKLNASMQSVCQVAWAQLLAAYTGQSCVTFGTILSGRNFEQEELNHVVFPCLSTMPFAINIKDTTARLLESASQQNANLLKHQHVSLTAIKKWCGVDENLFDTIFVLQTQDGISGESDFWSLNIDDARAEYSVSIEILPQNDDAVCLQLTSRSDLVPEPQASIILRQYSALLYRLMGVPLPDSSVEHKYKDDIFSALRAKDQIIAAEVRFLHEFVGETARKYPDRTALEFITQVSDAYVDRTSWTYAELDRHGNQIANLLTCHNAKIGDLVAVCFDKCSHASFAILGILKAGCTFVAIDPRAPPARRSFILNDAKCSIILTTDDKLDMFNDSNCTVVATDDEDSLRQFQGHPPQLDRSLTSDDSCYCLYTSGTTGTPKGCLISHSSAVQAMMSFQRIFQDRWTTESRWLQFASFHFDVSVLEQFWSWSVGIRVTSVPLDILFEDLPGTINKLAITHLDLTPSLARLLNPQDVPNLCDGVFIVGGEQVRQDVLDTWGDVGCLYNFYGPSEVTIGCTVRPQVTKNTRTSNIGQQWDNVGSFVLEADSQTPVLRGAIGELCLSGPLVGKGYLNRPDLTERKFVTLDGSDTRVYRTGDLVRLLHDDSFDFLGRMDDQVKLRGQRLEVGEINHVVLSSEVGVRNASTLVLKHPRQEKEQLVMFFATAENKNGKQSECAVIVGDAADEVMQQLRKLCTSRLPPYMVPTHFVMLNFIPLTMNNKMDAKALQTLYEGTVFDHDQNVPSAGASDDSSTRIEDKNLLSILASFFEVSETSIMASSRLLEIGLDSISVISLSRVLKRGGFRGADVPMIMSSSTVSDLASAVKQDSHSQADQQAIQQAKDEIAAFGQKHMNNVRIVLGASDKTIESCAPCTPLQQGMISTVAKNSSDDSTYFTTFTYKLSSHVSVEKLQHAWARTVEQVDILRTYFVATSDGHAQAVLKRTELENSQFEVRDRLSSIDEVSRQWITSARNFESHRPWRVCLATERGQFYIGLLIFHGLYDGISLPLLLRLVVSNYKGYSASAKNVPHFCDVLPYGPLLRPKGEKNFWINHLQHVQPLGLEGMETATYCSPMMFKTSTSLPGMVKLSKQLHTTIPAVFQAAWIHVLRTAYDIDPTIGMVVSGRSVNIERGEQAIGPLFNTIPFSVHNLSGAAKAFDLVAFCHKFNVESLPYQHTSVRNISKWLGVSARRGLFDSLFVFQRPFGSEAEDSASVWEEINPSSRPDYPLNAEVTQVDESQFEIVLVAMKSNKLSEANVKGLLDMFADTLNHFNRQDDFELAHVTQADISDRGSDRSYDSNHSIQEHHVVQNGSPRPELVSQIKSEVANLAEMDPESIGSQTPTLFEIGLDSVDVLKLAARLKKAQLTVSVNDIMQHPTVMGMALIADQRRTLVDTSPSLGRLVTSKQDVWRRLLSRQNEDLRDVEVILPVTPMQEGLLSSFSQYYHVLSYTVKSTTDIGKLTTAIESTVARSPTLRSTFTTVEDIKIRESFLQLVKSAETLHFTVSHTNVHRISDAIQELESSGRRLGISKHSLQATIATTSDGSYVLLLGIPHALYDGWSLQLFHDRIMKEYHGDTGSEDTADKLMAYLDHATADAFSDGAKSFWSKMLEHSYPTLFILGSTARSPRQSRVLEKSSKVSLQAVSKACKHAGVTLQSIGLACWSVMLATYTKSLNVTHGIVLSGRTTESSKDLLSPTFNTVCRSADLPTHASRVEFLKQTHNTTTQIMRHQHFPLKEAIKLTGRPQSQLFNTLFTFQKVLSDQNDHDDLYDEVEAEETHINPPFAVNVEMTEKDDQIWWTVAVQDDVASLQEVESVFSQLDGVLASFSEHLDLPLIAQEGDRLSICGMQPFKIHQQAISQRHKNGYSTLQDHEQSWTDVELTIRGVLAEASGVNVSTVQKATNIFNLGLDSISAIKVVGMLKRKGIVLPVSKLVEAQTIGDMATFATQRQDIGQVSKTSSSPSKTASGENNLDVGKLDIPKALVDATLPISAGQMYMLDMWSASKGNLFYANFWFEVDGASEESLSRAFTTLTERSPMLRSTFSEQDEHVYQVILTPTADLKRFKMPWSYRAIESQGKMFVRLTIHHALYDAVSLHLMVSALQKLCHNCNEDLRFNTDFQPFLRYIDANKNSQCREFWTSYLESLNIGRVDSSILTGSYSVPRSELFNPHVLSTKQLVPKLRRYGISIQSLLFAVYARVYARLIYHSNSSPNPDYVIIGVYLANRSLDLNNISELVAPTFNIVPLRISVGETTSLIESAKQIQRDLRTIAAPEHCGVSLRQIHDWTGTTVNTYFNFLKLPDEEGNTKEPVFEDHAINFRHAKGDALQQAQEAFSSTPDQQSNLASPFMIDNLEQTSPSSFTSRFNNPVPHRWCRPSIDIEATVSADGDLAVGLFAPSDMIDDAAAEEIISEIGDVMCTVAESG